MNFIKKQQAAFARVARDFALDLILLFGSQVKRKTGYTSDVDIAVMPQKDLDISDYSLLSHRLGKIIGNYNVDLTILKHAPPLLLGQIAKNCQLLYEKRKGDFLFFRLSAMKKYADAQPIFRCMEKHLQEKIRKYQKELKR